MIEPCWLDMHDVCAIHGEIIAESGGTSGIPNKGALESTLNKPINLYHYGDKRIALIAIYTFLSVNGVELTASEVDAASFFLDLAASLETQEESMDKLTHWIQRNSILFSEI
jgi:death on curing protein